MQLSSTLDQEKPVPKEVTSLWQKAEYWILFLTLLLLPADIALEPSLRSAVNAITYLTMVPLLLGRWKQILYLFSKEITLVLLLSLAVISISWSASPELSITYIKGLIRTTLVGACLAAAYTPQQQVQLLFKVFFTWGVMSFLSVAMGTGVGLEDGRWNGIFVFKYGLGSMMGLGATLSISYVLSKHPKSWFYLLWAGASALLIVRSHSITSLVSFLASLLLFPFYSVMKQYYKLRIFFLMTGLVFALVFTIFITSEAATILGYWGRDLTFTGRDTLWKAIIEQGLKHRFLGYGYSAFWATDESLVAVAKNGWPSLPPPGTYLTSFHSHNGFIEMFVQLGFLGLFLILINFLTLVSKLTTLVVYTKSVESTWFLQIIVIMVINNATEVCSFLAASQMFWILYVSITLTTALSLDRLKRKSLYRLSSEI